MATTAVLDRPGSTDARLSVDPAALEDWFTARALSTGRAQADYLGVDPSYLWRVKTGRRQPCTRFIAMVLLATPDRERGDTMARLFRPCAGTGAEE